MKISIKKEVAEMGLFCVFPLLWLLTLLLDKFWYRKNITGTDNFNDDILTMPSYGRTEQSNCTETY